MPLTDLVAPKAVIPALKVNSKKQAIQELAARAAELTGQGEREILEILQQREKLGSTGRSISRRSTPSRSTWSFSCSRRNRRAPIISRRSPASPA